MRKKIGILACLSTVFLPGQAQPPAESVEWTSLPTVAEVADTAYAKGVSAAYAGLVGDSIVLAGGCNFPGVAAADGGRKVFYADVFVRPFSDTSGGWTRIGRLPGASAYGVALPTDRGLALVGGSGADGPLASAYELAWSPDGRGLRRNPLPALPRTVDNMSGARVGRRLYVVGGNVGGTPSCRMFSLHLDSLAAGWREEPPFPGEPRVQPVAVALRRGGETCLFVFGGFAVGGAGRDASLSLASLCYVPSARRWEPVATPVDERGEPLSLGGGAAYAVNDTVAVCLGGVDKDIFLNALRREQRLADARRDGDAAAVENLQAAGRRYMTMPAADYRFNRRVLRYSAAADRWAVVAQADQAARAGAVLAGRGDTFCWMNGELKPGVRTPAVWQGRLTP